MSLASNEPKAGVVGWPISHSRSPIIHQHWLKKYNLTGYYDKFEVDSQEFKNFLNSHCRNELKGINVTIPLKELALKFCDETETVAREIGAVNTIWVEDGKLYGTNTDSYGFVANLDHKISNWDKNIESAVVIGAGGAAKAIVWALIDRGCSKVNIVNRTLSRAEEVALKHSKNVYAHDWHSMDNLLTTANIVINTTSLGMVGQERLKIDISRLPESAIVSDIVYTPLKTDLLKSAEDRSLRFIDGLGMLLYQAIPGFEKWFGVRPEVTDELRNELILSLGLDQ